VFRMKHVMTVLADHLISLDIARIGIIAHRHSENFAVQSFTFGLHSPVTPMIFATFKTKILKEVTLTLRTLYSRAWPLSSAFIFKF